LTPQEEQLLNSLAERVNSTQLEQRDPDAAALINKSFAPNPDALYILTQTVLVQNIALEQAKAQIARLQQATEAPQPARATSFLGSLLGHRSPQPGPAAVQSAPQSGYQPVNPQYAQPAPQFSQPEYVQPQYVPAGGGQPSFLRGAMQTAAGVAAGALAFEGVESILHGFGHPGYGWGGMGMGPGLMGGGFERPVEETVVNNYYDDPQMQGGEHRGLEAGEQHFHESSDQGGAQFNDAAYNTHDQGNDDFANQADDSGNFDNASDFDSANTDDGSGFDNSGGGFDDGGGGDVL
jgi:uncharacterized protein